jgi:hypothetical protein
MAGVPFFRYPVRTVPTFRGATERCAICHGPVMELHMTFSPGAEQSLHAGRYFNALANDMVDDVLTGMSPHHYRIEAGAPAPWAMRLWSWGQPSDETVLSLLPLVPALRADMRCMFSMKDREKAIPAIVARWLRARYGDLSFFIESLKPRHAFTPEERMDMSFAVLGGHLRMVSCGTIMFVEQAAGLFGLAVGYHGSYLFEQVGTTASPVVVR